MKHTECITLLGSHLSQTGNLMDDLNSDFCSRFRSCIKFYNFLRSNRRAPLSVKLEVLKACLVSSVMHNSEAFGHKDAIGPWKTILQTNTLGVRQSNPNLIVLIESVLLPLKALITSSQQGFFKRFGESLHHGFSRSRVFEILKQDKNEDYIQHYVTISETYSSKNEIYAEIASDLKDQFNKLADEGLYKYQIYRKMNPSLNPSPFLNLPHPPTDTGLFPSKRGAGKVFKDVIGYAQNARY